MPLSRLTPRAPGALIGLLVLVTALAGYLFTRDGGPIAAIERQTLDWRFQIRGPEPADDRIVLILIDDASLDRLGGWPISRRAFARAIDRLSAAGAGPVAIDVLLTESGERADSGGNQELLRAIERAGPVVLPIAFRFESGARNSSGAFPTTAAFRLVRSPEAGAPTMRFQPTGALAPTPAYASRAHLGHANFFPGGSDIVRAMHLALPYGERYYPALPLELVRLAAGVDRNSLVLVLGRGVRIADRLIETDSAMRATINYRGRGGGFERYPLIDLIEGRVPAERLEGRIVLIGMSATGLGDSFATPFSERLPGVALLATVTHNILLDRLIRSGPLARFVDLCALVGLGGILLLLILLRRPGLGAVAAGLAVLAWLVGSQIAFAEARLWLNVSIPGLTFLILGAIGLVGFARGEHRGRVRAEERGVSLGRYVSPLAKQQLEGKAARGSSAIHGIAMFVDVRAFTADSEAASPQDVAGKLQEFHRRVARSIANHRGMIDKYMGDGVLALFGSEGAGPDDAAAAVACAQDLSLAYDVAVGLHAGPLVIGELGSEDHAEISVVGDTVNVASRLQDLAKDLGAAIVASDAVIALARASGTRAIARFEPLRAQAVRGRAGVIDVWIQRDGH